MADLIPQPKARNLYLAQQVTQESINKLTQAIIDINEDDAYLTKVYSVYDMEYKPKPIKIYIDSYGGYVYQCFGLLSVMKASKVEIQTIVTGCAMSCGFMIAISGHKRFGYPKATYMYHQVSSVASGKIKDLEEDVIETKRLQTMIEEITLENTKITPKKLERIYKTKKDWFMNSEEALKLKVIDEII
jgi:ATP-dependent Clp protease protease subunit